MYCAICRCHRCWWISTETVYLPLIMCVAGLSLRGPLIQARHTYNNRWCYAVSVLIRQQGSKEIAPCTHKPKLAWIWWLFSVINSLALFKHPPFASSSLFASPSSPLAGWLGKERRRKECPRGRKGRREKSACEMRKQI